MSVLELDVLDRMDKVVVDDWAQCGRDDPFGALRPHVRAGLLTDGIVHAELGESWRDRSPGARATTSGFSSGTAASRRRDVALAQLMLERARERGLGTTLALSVSFGEALRAER